MESMFEKNLPQLALQMVRSQPLEIVNGSVVYGVYETWQQGELPAHPEVTCVRDAHSFEDAVANPDSSTIYIPHDARLTQELTRRILMRHSLPKTILWEAIPKNVLSEA